MDVWAIGCLIAEMTDGEPLFPGDSDIDQLHQIMRTLGPIPQRMADVFTANPLFVGVAAPCVAKWETLEKRYVGIVNIFKKNKLLNRLEKKKTCRFATWDPRVVSLMAKCLRYEPSERLTCEEIFGTRSLYLL